MNTKRRERLALAIFFVLIVLGGIILVGYFTTGRNWSVAATMVDDRVGQMEDYSVVVMNGVIPKEQPKGIASKQVVADENTTKNSSREETLGEKILSTLKRYGIKKETRDKGVYVSDVREVYSIKGASGASINLTDITRYNEPMILDTGYKKIGIFSLSSYVSRGKLKSVTQKLKDDGADSVFCIVPREAMVSTLDGIDVLILTEKRIDETDPHGSAETLVVTAPYVGEAGVVFLSSNNVASYKEIKQI